MDASLSMKKTLPGTAFEEARGRVESALKKHGFGVITEIDVRATLKEKLGEDFRNYAILGACNPPLAHQALLQEPEVGLLLPCNVVVTENDSGGTDVWMADPEAMIRMVPNPGLLEPLMHDARKRLVAALEEI